MIIEINGERKKVTQSITLQQLLDELNIDKRKVAVELNLTIVKKKDFDNVSINEGDRIEIVQFVGGG